MDINTIMEAITGAFTQLGELLAGLNLPVEEIQKFFMDIINQIMGLFA